MTWKLLISGIWVLIKILFAIFPSFRSGSSEGRERTWHFLLFSLQHFFLQTLDGVFMNSSACSTWNPNCKMSNKMLVKPGVFQFLVVVMILLQTKIMTVQGRKSGKITTAVKSEQKTCKWMQSLPRCFSFEERWQQGVELLAVFPIYSR